MEKKKKIVHKKCFFVFVFGKYNKENVIYQKEKEKENVSDNRNILGPS